jgi:hypothetical protein
MLLSLIFNHDSLGAMDLYLENHLGICLTSPFFFSWGCEIYLVWGGIFHWLTYPKHAIVTIFYPSPPLFHVMHGIIIHNLVEGTK